MRCFWAMVFCLFLESGEMYHSIYHKICVSKFCVGGGGVVVEVWVIESFPYPL